MEYIKSSSPEQESTRPKQVRLWPYEKDDTHPEGLGRIGRRGFGTVLISGADEGNIQAVKKVAAPVSERGSIVGTQRDFEGSERNEREP